MRFTLLDKKIELMLLTSTRCTIKGIERNMIYIALSINICNVKSLFTNISVI